MIRRTGFDLAQRLPTLPDLLAARKIDVVLDVGANTGQFGTGLRQWGYRGRIVSFEPLRAAFAELATHAASDGRWTAENIALGAAETTADLNVSDLSVFSSIRNPLAAVRDFDARAATVSVESVTVRRLDDVFDAHVRAGERAFLKIDTQGYESDVLDGAEGVMDRIDGVQLELSTRALYQDEALADAMVARMAGSGFVIGQLSPVVFDPEQGNAALLQFDASFVRPTT
jgi:FkbM family methyltransferase